MVLNTDRKWTQIEKQVFGFFFLFFMYFRSECMDFGLDSLNAWFIVISVGLPWKLSYNPLPIKIHFDLIFKLG